MTKAGRIPEVSVDAQYLSPFRIAFVPENIMAVGVSLKWDIFDWGRRKKEVANKAIVAEQAGIALQSIERRVASEVESEYRKVEDAQRLLEVVAVAQNAARERVRIVSERYARDAALMKDLMDAQASLAQADLQYQQAVESYMSARADFDKATAAR